MNTPRPGAWVNEVRALRLAEELADLRLAVADHLKLPIAPHPRADHRPHPPGAPMTTVLWVAALTVGGLLALAVGTLGVLALALWGRTRRLNKRGLAPSRNAVIDTHPIPTVQEGHTR